MSVAGPVEYSYVVENQGTRLDRYVSESCPELTRTQAQKLIGQGLVRVNGAVVRSGFKLSVGDRVTVQLT